MNVHEFPAEILPTLVEIAAGKGREDVREAYENLLLAEAPPAPELAGQLGDPGLIPGLLACLEKTDDTKAENRDLIVALADSVLELGGELGDLAKKQDRVRQANAQRLAQLAAGKLTGRPRRRRR